MEETLESGKLYIVSTPIGNLEDITLRALRVLKEADLIAAEDTRHTRGLLTHFDIHTPMRSFHIHNEHAVCGELLNLVRGGSKVALVSDAGTPGISDPGFLAVREAHEAGLPVEVIPGACAAVFAAVASALPIDKFAFYGFPPVKSGRRRKFFEALAAEGKTAFFYESPHRVNSALALIAECCGNVPVAIVREATKIHEEVIRGTAKELAERFRDKVWKGEFTIGAASGKGEEIEDDSETGPDDGAGRGVRRGLRREKEQ